FTKMDETASLNEICAGREMAILADEVFLDFGLAEPRQKSFAANAGTLSFTMSGISKISGLPQMKLAWLVTSGPEEWKSRALERLEIIADTYLSLNAPVQLAAPAFLEMRHGFQKQLLRRVRENLSELDRALAEQTLCSRLKVEGGWYAVLRVPSAQNEEDLAIRLLEARDVSVHPGHFYDFPAGGYLVISLIAPQPDFSEGIQRLLSLF
ncbi:MAG: aminotransferase class I/II-fold pyridoxal phosphate-dependent enzyme, partial [Candidatus Acidiferrales bacterium]